METLVILVKLIYVSGFDKKQNVECNQFGGLFGTKHIECPTLKQMDQVI